MGFFRFLRHHIASFLTLVFLAGLGAGWLSEHIFFDENDRFAQYTQEIFRREAASNTLNLHYILADPSSRGVRRPKVTFGEILPKDPGAPSPAEEYEEGLRQFSYDKLSEKNRITFDTLLLYYHTLRESDGYELLADVLSPGLGIQAQLPILLAEYAFYCRQDVEDYLELIGQTDDYFRKILEFEQKKSAAGYFMNDDCLDGVLNQCRDFIEDADNNYLLGIFEEKIQELPFLKDREKQTFIKRHRKLVAGHVIPAYQLLANGLEALRGSCENEKGLCCYPRGKEYYAHLLKTTVGVYDSPESIWARLQAQLDRDYRTIGELIAENPALIVDALRADYRMEDPQIALEQLEKASRRDFPALPDCSYTVKYVHESLEDYLSPAFYLTPPIDAASANAIYINNASRTTDIELFATLGHEGFPGHLYQNQFFLQSDPDDIRCIPDFGGYAEGWATYVESYAYSYGQIDEKLASLLWLNRSVNLCLCSLTDIGIHYRGWSLADTANYLENFGITDLTAVRQLYQAILENPANYLKYYTGYLNFLDLRTQAQSLWGDSFSLKEFHRQVLEIGPTQFPVLQKHLGLSLDQLK